MPMSDSDRGIQCPNCGARLITWKTKRLARGIIVRRKRCLTCPYRVTTEERPRPRSGPAYT